MPLIKLKTVIEAPIGRCCDLSRSIDLHKISTEHTKEEAIAGKTIGLIGLDEFVTWKAKHLGISQKLTTRITEFNSPSFFVDEMTKGAFKRFPHEHHFKFQNGRTIMNDKFDFTSPMGPLGIIADKLLITAYMTDLLIKKITPLNNLLNRINGKNYCKKYNEIFS